MDVVACIVAKAPNPTPRIVGLPPADAVPLERNLHNLVVAPDVVTTNPEHHDHFYVAARQQLGQHVWTWLAHYTFALDAGGRGGGFLGMGLLLRDASMEGRAILRLLDSLGDGLRAQLMADGRVPKAWRSMPFDEFFAEELRGARNFLRPLAPGGLARQGRRLVFLDGIGPNDDALSSTLDTLQVGRLSTGFGWVVTSPSPSVATRWRRGTGLEMRSAQEILSLDAAAAEPPDTAVAGTPTITASEPAAQNEPAAAEREVSSGVDRTRPASPFDPAGLERAVRAVSAQVTQLDARVAEYHRGVRLLRRGVALVGLLVVLAIIVDVSGVSWRSTPATKRPEGAQPPAAVETSVPGRLEQEARVQPPPRSDDPMTAANASEQKSELQAPKSTLKPVPAPPKPKVVVAKSPAKPKLKVDPKETAKQTASKDATKAAKPAASADAVGDALQKGLAETARKAAAASQKDETSDPVDDVN